MPIKLPQETTYFYEITIVADRLYYCIPKQQLYEMVNQEKVLDNIIEDYPDGIDIKVSQIQFDEIQKCYGMAFNIIKLISLEVPRRIGRHLWVH